MGIIRKGIIPIEDQFVMIPNAWMRDERLSYKARGMLAAAMTHADGFMLSEKGFTDRGTEGTAAIRAGIKEMRDAGYIVVKKKRGPGGRLLPQEWLITSPPDHHSTETQREVNTTGGESPPKKTNSKKINSKNTNIPTPSPLRDDEEKDPIAIERGSTVNEGKPNRTEEHTAELRKLLHGMIDSTEYEYPVLAEEFIERFEEIHGAGSGMNDAEDLFWNKRYEERLHDEVRAARAEKGHERGLQYAVAKWLSTYTNHVTS